MYSGKVNHIATTTALPTNLPEFKKAGGIIVQPGQNGLNGKPHDGDKPQAQIKVTSTVPVSNSELAENDFKLVATLIVQNDKTSSRRGYDIHEGRKSSFENLIARAKAGQLSKEEIKELRPYLK